MRSALLTLLTGPACVLAVAAVLLLSACGGGSGADETHAGQCYVAGMAQPDEACRPQASAQPVQCNASGVCR